MTVTTFDTHEIVKKMLAAGFNKAQAEGVTGVVRETRDIDLTNLATKTYLVETKADILKWMVSSIGLQTAVIISAVVALVRTLH